MTFAEDVVQLDQVCVNHLTRQNLSVEIVINTESERPNLPVVSDHGGRLHLGHLVHAVAIALTPIQYILAGRCEHLLASLSSLLLPAFHVYVLPCSFYHSRSLRSHLTSH